VPIKVCCQQGMPLNQTTAGCNITLELDGLQSLLKRSSQEASADTICKGIM